MPDTQSMISTLALLAVVSCTTAARKPVPNQTAALTQTPSISGIVFRDLNTNRRRDPNELGVVGLTIFLDRDADEVLDENETRVTTDSEGNYSFSSLPPGKYRVRVAYDRGWIPAAPHPTDVTVEAGKPIKNIDFPSLPSRAIAR